VVVVGNGMAGMRTVEELVARAPDRLDITVMPKSPFNLPAGTRSTDIHLIAGNHTTAIDPVTRRVALADGAPVPYDKLLLATGSKPLTPPIPGLDFANVRALRDIADVEAMIEAARNHRRAAARSGSKRRGD